MGYVCTGCKEKSFLLFDSVALEIVCSSERTEMSWVTRTDLVMTADHFLNDQLRTINFCLGIAAHSTVIGISMS